MNQFVKKQEICKYLQVSSRCVEEWMKKKKIPFLRLGRRCVRFDLEKVEEALKKFDVNCRENVEVNSEEKYSEKLLQELLNTEISELELPIGTHNSLVRNQCTKIRDLTSKTEAELYKFKRFGKKSMMAVKEKLQSVGLKLGMNTEFSNQ